MKRASPDTVKRADGLIAALSPSRSEPRSRGEDLADALYALADITAARNGVSDPPRHLLDRVDDIGIVDDVIDALLDPAQAVHARKILRAALAEIARQTLSAADDA